MGGLPDENQPALVVLTCNEQAADAFFSSDRFDQTAWYKDNHRHGEKPALERQIEELQTLIGSRRSRSVFKTAVEELRPSWAEVELARVAEGLTVKRAMKLSGLSRSSYYRQVRGMKDYRERGRQVPSAQHREVLREVALKEVEAGHRRVRAYALA